MYYAISLLKHMFKRCMHIRNTTVVNVNVCLFDDIVFGFGFWGRGGVGGGESHNVLTYTDK